MRSLGKRSYTCFDGALLAGDEKKNKIAPLFSPLPIETTAFAVLAAILFFFSLAALAKAENTPPRWVITSASDPTNIKPDSPSTKVLATATHAEGGTFTLDTSGDEGTTKPIAYDATPEEVFTAIAEVGSDVSPAHYVHEHITVTG